MPFSERGDQHNLQTDAKEIVMSNTKKVAVITGASSGIGEALARELSQAAIALRSSDAASSASPLSRQS
jgi:short-subunit dehydrogenase involved in D-alanine esterification of teichoic acids